MNHRRQMQHVTLALAMAGGVLLAWQRGGAANLPLPFVESFAAITPGRDWTNHLEAGNTTTLTGEAVQFRARANTQAHIERSLGADLVRISCAFKVDATTTPSLVTLHWDASNFIQFGFNAPVTGRINVREVLGTYPHDYELADASTGEWRYVGIELARDCVRYLASRDGKNFETLRVSPRPARFAGPPKRLTLGQDGSGKMFARPSPWVGVPANDATRISWVRELRIEALSKTQLNATAAELRQFAVRERDRVGEQELAAQDDPSFASVSGHFPAIKWSREIVGVKDHPFNIGIASDASLQLSDDLATTNGPTAHFELDNYRFGSANPSCAKNLREGWMPIVTTHDHHGALELLQTAFGWTEEFSADKPLFGYVQLTVWNSATNGHAVELKLQFDAGKGCPAPLVWPLNIPARSSEVICVRVPFDIRKTPATQIGAEEFQAKLADTTAYWSNLIAPGTLFEIPEPRVQNAYRAWLAYNFLNVAKRQGVYEVCDGSGFYGKVYGYSAALYCNGLDLLGYPELAETYCDSLLSFAHTNGLLAVNFGDTDTGTALWVMAEHYRLTRDETWLRRVVPKMQLMCSWIVGQRHAALAKARKEPAVTRGLIRYRPYADLLHPAADYFSNGYLWKGLEATARVFREIGLSAEAAGLQREADAYLKDIKASMTAAVFRDRGQRILPMIPDTHELWLESNGSANGYYGIIAPCLLEIGLPAANDTKAKLITDALEWRGGLVAGISQFHSMADHAYAYGYWMNCLQRDEVKRAILGLYGSLAYGMSTDTYSAVECTAIRTGENYWMLPHTYSNTQQLRLLRNMLVREDGETLWLGQAIPRPWLAPGQRVAVNEAPTTFGPVSYSIEPKADGSMHVELSPPVRSAPQEIMFRLRDPKQRKIVQVRSSGSEKVKFRNDTLRLARASAPVTLEVSFR